MANKDQLAPVTDESLRDLLESRSNNAPVPILKHKAENRIMRELKALAMKGCCDEIGNLANCSQGKLFSVVWQCRAYKKAVDNCMNSFGKDEALKNEMRRRHARQFPQSVKGHRPSPNAAEKAQSQA